MRKRNNLKTADFAKALIDAINDPDKLTLTSGVRSFHDNTYITLKGKPLGRSLESYTFDPISIHNAAKLLIDNAINPLSKELPAAYDAGIDWLESQLEVTELKEEKPYWETRIAVLRKNSPTLKNQL